MFPFPSLTKVPRPGVSVSACRAGAGQGTLQELVRAREAIAAGAVLSDCKVQRTCFSGLL